MVSQAYSQGIHLVEKSDFSLLRTYIEQEISNASLQQLVDAIQNSQDSEVSPIRMCVEASLLCPRHVSIHSSFPFDWTCAIKCRV